MTFKATINFKEFLKTQYYLAYSKGIILWGSFWGFFMLIGAVLGFSNAIPKAIGGNYFLWLIFGLLTTFLFPFSVYTNAKKLFKTNQRIKEEIVYEITNESIKFTGESFTSTLDLSKTFKIREVKYFFLVYESNQIANFISKSKLAEIELIELRNILKKSSVTNISLKK